MELGDKKHVCICGSWKKKKHCYYKMESENLCSIFLQENREKYIKLFQTYMDSIVSEVSSWILLLNTNQELVRIKFILIFSMLDVLSNFWKTFENLKNTNSKLDISDRYSWNIWFKAFVLRKENNEWFTWQENNPWTVVNWTDFYDIRSSLVHFFWIWENSQLCLVSKSDEKNKLIFSSIGIFEMDHIELFKIVLTGCTLMINTINHRINTDNEALVNLRKLYLKIEKEWANRIRYEDLHKA